VVEKIAECRRIIMLKGIQGGRSRECKKGLKMAMR
jgi:hypothetical protein